MRFLVLTGILLCFCCQLFAQQKTTYTIKADSVKITNCDSSELIIENHTQAVPGFLFNTGNGRTVFKRALQSIGNSAYVIGADTLQLPVNAWTQGGNAFGAPGILGTLDNNTLDLYQSGNIRQRFFNNGNVAIGSPDDAGYKLYVAGGIRADQGATLLAPLAFQTDSAGALIFANTLTFTTANNLGNNTPGGMYIFTNQTPAINSGDGPARLVRLNKIVARGYEDGEETALRIDFTVTDSASDLRAVDAASGNVVVETGNLLMGATTGSTSKVDIIGNSGFSQLRLRTQYTPSSSSDSNGNPGDTAVDDNYFYYKTSTGWKRVALSSF